MYISESGSKRSRANAAGHFLSLVLTLVAFVTLLSPMPAVSQSANAASDPATITGRLEVLWEDDFANGRARVIHILEDALSKRRYRLHFDGEPPANLRSGAIVTARGRPNGADLNEVYLAADSTEPQPEQTAAAAAASGEQRILVMMANFSDKSADCSVDFVRDAMFTDPANESVDDLYRETSFGQTWLTGQVLGTYNINYSSNSCDLTPWAEALDAAALADGVDPNSYQRKVYVLPGNACSGAGYGSSYGSPTRAWIMRCDFKDTYAHELGHNMGMGHAATPSANYGDLTDFMGTGNGKLRHNNAPHKAQMGWLSDVEMQTVTQSGSYDVAPLELSPSTALTRQALKIYKPDSDEYYYLSYRRAIGFDASLSPVSQLDRLAVHRIKADGSSGRTYLLAQLADGESFVDTVNGITVTQVSHTPDYTTAQVQMEGSGPSCSAAAPQLSLSPASQGAAAGTTLNYAVSVTNQDNSLCAASTFYLDASASASGWVATPALTALTLAPGATQQTTLAVTSPASAAAGSHGITLTVSDPAEPSHTRSGSVAYVVENTACTGGSAVDISPASQAADAGNTLQYAVDITNNDASGCENTSVSLSTTLPASDWSDSISPSTLSLAPGQTVRATVAVTSPGSATPGSYSLLTHAAGASTSASAKATYAVMEPAPDPTVDNDAPTAPGALSASGKRKHVNLSWAASTDNVGVTGYQVWRNGALLTNTTSNGYTDRAISAGESYTYFVVAFDAAMNISDPSNIASATISGGKGKGRPGN